MRLQLLPSTFEENGTASARQHLTSFVIDDCVAFDAGSLAMASSRVQKEQIRDIVLSHAHLDHIAGLPLFLDDLFASLTEPVRIYAEAEVVKVLERDIFNWSVYPRFSELTNANGSVMEYRCFEPGAEFKVRHLNVQTVSVNHKVPSSGFIVSDDSSKFALTGDTASMSEFWNVVNKIDDLSAVLVECAFPDELEELAHISHHLTPSSLQRELAKFKRGNCPIYVANLKPAYYEKTAAQIAALGIANLSLLEVGRIYEW
ncbi:MAG: 3',5'-cyclic-nucleotide phosphodiesterase [Saprospiraceae bacterium]|nr:3',5'-cyclic-nucleotide phosphodiesterase [Pyrinomonadaceae bacterium]